MPSINTALPVKMYSHHEPALKKAAAQKPEKPESPPRPSSAPAPEAREKPDAPRAKGVLRLLGEEGHFNQIARLRLSMKFHTELQEIDAAAQTESTLAAAKQLRVDMATTLAETGAGLDESLVEPVNALFGQFDQVVGVSFDDGAAAGSDLQSKVTDALANLRNGLADLLETGDAPTPSDSSANGEVPGVVNVPGDVEAAGETTGDAIAPRPIVQLLIDDVDQLTAAFEKAVSSVSLLSGIEDIDSPRGNGVAFEKFMEQYQAQFASSVDQSGESPRVDEQV